MAFAQSASPWLKPTGTPTIVSGNPINNNLGFYVFDTGLGQYAILQDSSPGHLMYPPNKYRDGVGGPDASDPTGVPALATNAYGTAFDWPGSSVDYGQSVGETSNVAPTDSIRTAQNLYNQPAGAGLTMATWFIIDTSSNTNEPVIFGRTARGFTEAGAQRVAGLFTEQFELPGAMVLYQRRAGSDQDHRTIGTGAQCAAFDVRHVPQYVGGRCDPDLDH